MSEKSDMVNHPAHYNKHPRGIEVIDFVEHMDFCTGNAIKYLCRAEHKGNELEDLRKAIWYIQRKIDTLENKNENKGRIVSIQLIFQFVIYHDY